ncbi:50S ribosomal protein L21 [Candidatus Peregrinibacteria bacterium CG10_big_fil_rev_8_21_14_0_10_49_16]|nr:MAG: 50S ribosomal protein L21 [Candidatus Peregrinibacteria bacterium CG22_combo_CG10-13_8_21_14_all_49_11]PIR52055.1 MAG: 50S ribosomal protein L21 [Candidatus Peregrinibacteria bacterium CG10_big_fil_rev_8_21_14_0_10_49_16]
MFAIANVAGFQEKLEKGMRLKVPRLEGEEGKKVVFSEVLLIANDDEHITVGKPHIAGASVEAKILSHGKGDKIRVFKMKRRKRYRRTHGHKQQFTEIEVTGITVK